MSSRTVISNGLHDEQCVDRSGKTPNNGDMPADNANIAALPSSGNCGKRSSSKRQKFFQQFQDTEGQLTSYEPATISQYHENEAAPVSNLCDRAASNERYVNSASQRFFQQYEAPQPEMTGHASTCDVDEVMPDAIAPLDPFGQAAYQKSRQGLIVDYQDSGNSSFECNHCGAYFWKDTSSAC